MNKQLKTELIKLGTTNPELRPHIRHLLASQDKTAFTGFDIARHLKTMAQAVMDEEKNAAKYEANVGQFNAFISLIEMCGLYAKIGLDLPEVNEKLKQLKGHLEQERDKAFPEG